MASIHIEIEHEATVDRPIVQLEAKEAGHIPGARVQAAGRRHRHVEWRLRIEANVAHGAVFGRPDHRPVERAVVHAEWLEQQFGHQFREGLALDPLQDVPS